MKQGMGFFQSLGFEDRAFENTRLADGRVMLRLVLRAGEWGPTRRRSARILKSPGGIAAEWYHSGSIALDCDIFRRDQRRLPGEG